MIDLNDFCQKDGSPAIATPWTEGRWTYASNGHLLLRVERREEVPEKIEAPKVSGTSLGEALEKRPGMRVVVPELHIRPVPCSKCKGTGKQYTCPECGGEGEVTPSTEWNNYDEQTCLTCDGNGQLSKDHWLKLMPKRANPAGDDCHNCDGTGKTCVDKPVKIGEALFTDSLLAMIAPLPHCEIGVIGRMAASRFRFDGGDGLIMPRSE
jgi:hypothetical protein